MYVLVMKDEEDVVDTSMCDRYTSRVPDGARVSVDV